MSERKKCLELCEDCGKPFMAGPNAFFCPDCRKARIAAAARESAKKRNLNKIGNDAYSEQCAIARKERNRG